MYHQIIDPTTLPYPIQHGMYVTPNTFKKHINILKKDFNVLPLKDLIEILLSDNPQKLPKRAIALTFDDGWKSTYTNAYPILKENNLPATIFLATSFIAEQKLFWTESAGFLVKNPNAYDFIIDECLDPLEQYSLKQIASSSDKDPAIRVDQVINFFMGLAIKKRELLLRALSASILKTFDTSSFLSNENILEMSNHNITFASHTHEHSICSKLTDIEFKEDIKKSLNYLQSIGITPLPFLCYPNGDFNSDNQQALAALGIKAAITVNKLDLKNKPPLISRVGIHEDIASTRALFISRCSF